MIKLIGVGNPWRRDDGVGIWIARRLAGLNLPGVEVLERNGEGAELLEAWGGADRVYLFDALKAGGSPGTVRRIDAHRQSLPRDMLGSSHALGVAEAVELARTLGELPAQLLIFGVEGINFGMGEDLSVPATVGAWIVLHQIVLGLDIAG